MFPGDYVRGRDVIARVFRGESLVVSSCSIYLRDDMSDVFLERRSNIKHDVINRFYPGDSVHTDDVITAVFPGNFVSAD